MRGRVEMDKKVGQRGLKGFGNTQITNDLKVDMDVLKMSEWKMLIYSHYLYVIKTRTQSKHHNIKGRKDSVHLLML